MCRFCLNPHVTDTPSWTRPEYAAFESSDILRFHRSIPGYSATPLLSLPVLAEKTGVSSIFVKDESRRFDLKAFKVMGASYAIYRFIKSGWERKFGVEFEIDNLYQPELLGQMDRPTFCAATDGNHGRAVAWFSRLLGCKAVVYMPAGSARARVGNIRSEGAVVEVIDGEYDEAVGTMAADAERNGWHIISDMSWPGHTETTGYVMAGYTTMFREIDDVLRSSKLPYPTHIIFQSGVGSFAAAGAWYYYRHRDASGAKLISVEPTRADCLLESALEGGGDLRPSRGDLGSIMAGLNCRTPSLIGWPLIRDRFAMFLSMPDDYSKAAMRQYYYPHGEDPRIISGESGAAGLGALLALSSEDSLAEARRRLSIDDRSVILLFNTEGDTDPENFIAVTGSPGR
ncbi:MAG: diaminopropionate ammonia-lyase [Candidatus Zixiibacteriota bacterium]|nr:MAG: diaminopropionate ammonia-lyase [candidate division Zixibacteria bacterium]